MAAHYRKRPETLTNQQVQDYLLYLIRERGLAWYSCNVESHRMLVRVEQGKGRKDRYTLLSAKSLEYLRLYWQAFQPQSYLFFGRFKDMPMSATTAQRIYYRAKKAAGITRGKGIHTLRHCFATHLLEQGINIYHIKRFLGHASIQTTMVYFHVQPDRHLSIQSPLDISDRQPSGGCHESTVL